MFKDTQEKYSSYGFADLSAKQNYSIINLLDFIKQNISGFRDYYLKTKMSKYEDAISHELIYYLNSCLLEEKEGFTPYNFNFIKHPPQKDSKKETDIGVVLLNKNRPSLTLLEFEAKRLSKKTNTREYVYGNRGGIERFKRGFHASHLKICGMFGYVQDNSYNWTVKINEILTELGSTNTDDSIDWVKQDEKLRIFENQKNVEILNSIHSRRNNLDIQLYHYHLNLTQ